MTTPKHIQEVKKQLKDSSIQNKSIKTHKLNGVNDYISGFLTIDDQHFYVSVNFNKSALDGDRNVMFRTAKDYKDFSGGNNNWCEAENLITNIKKHVK